MSEKINVKKIVLKIGDKEIPLTVDEAKELRDILDKTFGSPPTTTYIPWTYPIYYPSPHWYVTSKSNTVDGNDITVYCASR